MPPLVVRAGLASRNSRRNSWPGRGRRPSRPRPRNHARSAAQTGRAAAPPESPGSGGTRPKSVAGSGARTPSRRPHSDTRRSARPAPASPPGGRIGTPLSPDLTGHPARNPRAPARARHGSGGGSPSASAPVSHRQPQARHRNPFSVRVHWCRRHRFSDLPHGAVRLSHRPASRNTRPTVHTMSIAAADVATNLSRSGPRRVPASLWGHARATTHSPWASAGPRPCRPPWPVPRGTGHRSSAA